ncbi:MAG: hypothetical protein ABSC05_18830 [Candidatus Solibacter sp.]
MEAASADTSIFWRIPAAPNAEQIIDRRKVEAHSNAVAAVTFSPDGTKVASGSSVQVRIADSQTGEALFVVEEHEHAVVGLAFSPDSSRLAVSDRNCIYMWALEDAHRTSTLRRRDHWNCIRAVTWSREGSRVASASFDSVRVWEARTGHLSAVCNFKDTFGGIIGKVHGVGLSDCGRFVTAITEIPDPGRSSAFVFATTWNVASQTKVVQLVIGNPDEDPLIRDVPRPLFWDETERRLVFPGSRDSLSYWQNRADARVAAAEAVAWSWSRNGGVEFAACADGTIRVIDGATGRTIQTLRGGHGGTVHISAAGADSLLAGVGGDGKVRLWDWRKGMHIADLDCPDGTVKALGWSDDDELLFVCTQVEGHWNVRAWDRRAHLRVVSIPCDDANLCEVYGGETLLEPTVGDQRPRLWWPASVHSVPGQSEPGRWASCSGNYFEILVMESRFSKS